MAPIHVSVRAYAGFGGLIGQVAPLIRGNLVPHLRQVPGFLGHCSFASEDGHFVSITMFRDRSGASQVDGRFEDGMLAQLGDAARASPRVAAGETLLHEIARVQTGDHPPMFIVVRSYVGLGPKEEVLPRVREHVFLTITGAPGFRGYYAFLDGEDATRGVAVSLFDNRDHAMEANERVLAVMRDRHIAPNPPAIMAGPTVVVAAA